MENKKNILFILFALIGIKFVFIPWLDWVDAQALNNNKLMTISSKQANLIENKELLAKSVEATEQIVIAFLDNVPETTESLTANTLWLNFVESIKNKNVKIYQQKVEFETLVLENVGYVTGTFYISGSSFDVMNVLSTIEKNSPYAFFEQIKLTGFKDQNKLTVHLYLGYWFKFHQVVAP